MCDSGNLAGKVGSGINDSNRAAGEQTVNISQKCAGAGYNLAGAGLKNSPVQTSICRPRVNHLA